jgi:hypothetical protein
MNAFVLGLSGIASPARVARVPDRRDPGCPFHRGYLRSSPLAIDFQYRKPHHSGGKSTEAELPWTIF